MCGCRRLCGYRGHGFDEHHASLLQRQRAATVGRLGGSEAAPWAGACDEAHVLQGKVEDGGTGAVEAVGLLSGVGRSSGFKKTDAGGRYLLGNGGSGAWRRRQ